MKYFLYQRRRPAGRPQQHIVVACGSDRAEWQRPRGLCRPKSPHAWAIAADRGAAEVSYTGVGEERLDQPRRVGHTLERGRPQVGGDERDRPQSLGHAGLRQAELPDGDHRLDGSLGEEPGECAAPAVIVQRSIPTQQECQGARHEMPVISRHDADGVARRTAQHHAARDVREGCNQQPVPSPLS